MGLVSDETPNGAVAKTATHLGLTTHASGTRKVNTRPSLFSTPIKEKVEKAKAQVTSMSYSLDVSRGTGASAEFSLQCVRPVAEGVYFGLVNCDIPKPTADILYSLIGSAVKAGLGKKNTRTSTTTALRFAGWQKPATEIFKRTVTMLTKNLSSPHTTLRSLSRAIISQDSPFRSMIIDRIKAVVTPNYFNSQAIPKNDQEWNEWCNLDGPGLMEWYYTTLDNLQDGINTKSIFLQAAPHLAHVAFNFNLLAMDPTINSPNDPRLLTGKCPLCNCEQTSNTPTHVLLFCPHTSQIIAPIFTAADRLSLRHHFRQPPYTTANELVQSWERAGHPPREDINALFAIAPNHTLLDALARITRARVMGSTRAQEQLQRDLRISHDFMTQDRTKRAPDGTISAFSLALSDLHSAYNLVANICRLTWKIYHRDKQRAR
jgi:hypothetical protein